MTTTTESKRRRNAAVINAAQVADDAIETSADVLRQQREADKLRAQHARLYRDIITRMADNAASDDDVQAAGALAERHGWDVVRDMKLLIEVRTTHRKYSDGFEAALAAASDESKRAVAELASAIAEKAAVEKRIYQARAAVMGAQTKMQTAQASRQRMVDIATGFPHLFGE